MTTSLLYKLTNKLLLFSCIIGHLPKIFFNSRKEINLGFFVERPTQIVHVALYLSTHINFLILALCLYLKKYVDEKVSLYILIICSLDFVHLITLAKQGFGLNKLWMALIIYVVLRYVNNKEVI